MPSEVKGKAEAMVESVDFAVDRKSPILLTGLRHNIETGIETGLGTAVIADDLKLEAKRVRELAQRRVDELRAERGTTLAEISRKCGKGAQYFSEWFSRGHPQWLPEGVRRPFAQLTGLNEQELKPPSARAATLAPTMPDRRNARMPAGDAEQVELSTAPPDIQKMADAYPRAEVWRILTNVIEASGYLPGDYVIVDGDRQARLDDFVLVSYRRDGNVGPAEPLLRRYLPHHVIQYSPNLPSDPLYVDDRRVTIRGVVRQMIRLADK